MSSIAQSTYPAKSVCAEYPASLFKQSMCEIRHIKGSQIEERQGVIDVLVAIKTNYFLLHHNEIASAMQNTRIVSDYNSGVNLCALMEPGLF